jgi:sugar (pentulose or hexulose) kinase
MTGEGDDWIAWVGVDLGTQSVRASALRDDGRPIGTTAEPLRSVRVGVRHEQDPAEWWTATASALRRLMAMLPSHVVVSGLAISGTSGTVVPVDRGSGRALGMAVMYDDRRGSAWLPRVEVGGADLWSRLGYRMQSSWALPTMLELLADGDLPDGAVLAHQPDVVTSRLAGRLLPSDLSSALKSGVDLDRAEWPGEVLAELGLPVSDLNTVAFSGEIIGTVDVAGTAETGLPTGCPIVAGMTDGCAAQIAAGALTPGSWNAVLGTTLVLKGVSSTRRTVESGAVYSHRAPFDLGWFPGGASSTGAGAFTALLPGRDLDRLTARFDPDAAPPIAYPLVGRGERFPFVADDATGVWPFDLDHADDDQVFSAILHGVAFLERLAVETVASAGFDVTGPYFVTGGGSRNPIWNRLRSDMLGRRVRVPVGSEGAAGMAMLAAAGVAAANQPPDGRHASGASASPLAAVATRMLGSSQPIDPDPRRHERLGEGYAEFVGALSARGWLAEPPTDTRAVP